MYHLYSENKGADQLRSYCAAYLRLCFACAKIRVSHDVVNLYYSACLFATQRCTMIKDKNKKGIEKEKQGKEGEESELQKCFDLEVKLKLFILVSIKRAGRSKNLLLTG